MHLLFQSHHRIIVFIYFLFLFISFHVVCVPFFSFLWFRITEYIFKCRIQKIETTNGNMRKEMCIGFTNMVCVCVCLYMYTVYRNQLGNCSNFAAICGIHILCIRKERKKHVNIHNHSRNVSLPVGEKTFVMYI